MTQRISILKLVVAFAIVTVVGFSTVVGISNWALNDLRVDGPLYGKIKLGNDLVADILPPPEYVIEAYLEATLAIRDPSSLAARRARLSELHKDYDDRRDYWRKSDLDASLKRKLTEQSDADVQRFWKASEQELLPALESKDAAAAENAYAELTSAYASHRAVIDAIVKRANDDNAALESEAAASVKWFSAAAWGISGTVCLLIAVGLAGIIFGVVRPISRLTETMRRLAEGDLSAEIPALTRRDEIGAMAAAIQVFHGNATQIQQSDRRMLDLAASADQERRSALIDMCDILEADLDSAVAEVLTISDDASRRGEQAAADAQLIAAEACQVAASSEQATGTVTSVSAAAEELSAAGREIAQRAVEMARFAHNAVEEAGQAGATVASLNEAAARIGAVVNLISEVASQTNLLALNATIEAARAGDAGRGFAVVAQEVKALSRKTSDAAEDISRRIADICQATEDSVGVIGKIANTVAGIEELTGAVAAAAEQQEATLLEVARSLSEASQGVATVSANVTKISGRSAEIESQACLVSGLVNGTNRRVSELRGNLVASLRSSSAGDRRSLENRRPISVAARLRCGAESIEGTILDLSDGGLRFRTVPGQKPVREGVSTVIETKSFGDVSGRIIAVGESSVHVAFEELSDPRRQAISDFLRSIDEADRSFVGAARETATAINRTFEAAIAKGEISELQMFDVQYRPIPETDPQQFETAFTALCDRVLPDHQEPILALDPRVVFCAAVDKNAFLPTHNRKFSQAQRAGDPMWNAANSRNRRFFKDSAGIRAARTNREFLMQTYDRDMAGGTVVTLKEVDVPIRIGGKHWGGLRLAFKA